MSYQVLARKWRPRIFRDLVGQEHVLQALVNALDRDRLHHAYLFTGTRGVGKTTIARILARCLNCETGVSSEPCGTCSSCTEINDGRFVDLLEVDAASRTKVEDTRELLDNVQYAPTRGRFKVYLIDEVHMLSGHSFNALLKTLEEPPPHVKFLLATTDPQKLPATILSRCLQFHLKNLTPERISGHLKYVLEQEMVESEEPALLQLGQAARGSMRDALSLTDQAIAYGSGKVISSEVAAMLGTVDRGSIVQLLADLIAGNGEAVFDQVAHLAEFGADYQGILDELISLLHGLAVQQVVPGKAGHNPYDGAQLVQMAQQVSAEELQLYYQMALNGRRDMPYVPEPRSGLEMVLLRMLAFKPLQVPDWAENGVALSSSVDTTAVEAAAPGKKPETGPRSGLDQQEPAEPPVQSAPVERIPPVAKEEQPAPPQAAGGLASGQLQKQVSQPARLIDEALPQSPAQKLAPVPQATKEPERGTQLKPPSELNWARDFPLLPLKGIVQNMAANCQLVMVSGDDLHFVLEQGQATLFDETYRQRLEDNLADIYGKRLRCLVEVGSVTAETPAAYAARRKQERLQQAIAQLESDANVRMLKEKFGGTLELDSIQPL
jgi:DNA polymerase-3 subunit gamma/tau